MAYQNNKPETITFVDTETNGLLHRTCHVIQLAYIKVELVPKEPWNMRLIVEREYKLKLPEGVVIPPKVAELNGYSEEVWAKEAQDRGNVIDVFLRHLEWTKFGGQNTQFDYRFLDEELYRQKKDWPRMASYALTDVAGLAEPLMRMGHVPNVKQVTLCEFFNLGVQTHDALDDVRQAVDVYRKLMLWTGGRKDLAEVRAYQLPPLVA